MDWTETDVRRHDEISGHLGKEKVAVVGLEPVMSFPPEISPWLGLDSETAIGGTDGPPSWLAVPRERLVQRWSGERFVERHHRANPRADRVCQPCIRAFVLSSSVRSESHNDWHL